LRPAGDVAHLRFADLPGLRGSDELRVLGKDRHRLCERAAQIEEQPCAGGAVMVPPPQRLEQGIARELGHEV